MDENEKEIVRKKSEMDQFSAEMKDFARVITQFRKKLMQSGMSEEGAMTITMQWLDKHWDEYYELKSGDE